MYFHLFKIPIVCFKIREKTHDLVKGAKTIRSRQMTGKNVLLTGSPGRPGDP